MNLGEPDELKKKEVDVVLKYLETMHPAASLSDFDLSVKTATLAFILSLSRFCHLI